MECVLEKTPEEMMTPVYRPFKDGPFQMTMREMKIAFVCSSFDCHL